MSEPQPSKKTEGSQDALLEKQQQKKRNIAIALMIIAFIAIIYAVTVIRISGSLQ